MGIMVDSLLWVMQDLYHQPCGTKRIRMEEVSAIMSVMMVMDEGVAAVGGDDDDDDDDDDVNDNDIDDDDGGNYDDGPGWC